MPEFRPAIEAAETPMQLWFHLRAEFELAFKQDDKKQLARLLAYARWCWTAPDHATSNAVAVGFYEHLPEHDDIREAIPTLFRKQEFDRIRSALAIHVGETAMDEIARAYRKSCRS